MTRALAWIGFLVLIATHLDFWREQRPVLWFGWLPEDILYRLVWMGFAAAYLWWFTSAVWQSDDEEAAG